MNTVFSWEHGGEKEQDHENGGERIGLKRKAKLL